MSNRTEEIKDTAEKFYLNNEQNNYDDERLYRAFIRGAEWADNNPSEETIDKILDLVYDANKEVRLHMVNPDGISLNTARDIQIKYIKANYTANWADYVKKHFND